MRRPTETELFDAVDATWAPLNAHTHKGWLVREGAGGGKRVSAATLLSDLEDAGISSAVEKLRSLGQHPLFMIRNSDSDLDCRLQHLSYDVIDPVVILAEQTQRLLITTPKARGEITAPTSPNDAAKAIWAAGGIGQDRLNVMARVSVPKAVLIAGEMGVAFAAAYNGIAMVHAVEVAKDHRRKGVANALMRKAAEWAADQNCEWMAVLTVKENIAARTLYEKLGMAEATAYHYRIKL